MMDKPDLMEKVLDRYGIRFKPNHAGWQGIQCPDEAAHAHGDKNPSCRLNITLGLVRCMGCDLVGDGYNVMMTIENIDFLAAKEQLGKVRVEEESDWII